MKRNVVLCFSLPRCTFSKTVSSWQQRQGIMQSLDYNAMDCEFTQKKQCKWKTGEWNNRWVIRKQCFLTILSALLLYIYESVQEVAAANSNQDVGWWIKVASIEARGGLRRQMPVDVHGRQRCPSMVGGRVVLQRQTVAAASVAAGQRIPLQAVVSKWCWLWRSSLVAVVGALRQWLLAEVFGRHRCPSMAGVAVSVYGRQWWCQLVADGGLRWWIRARGLQVVVWGHECCWRVRAVAGSEMIQIV